MNAETPIQNTSELEVVAVDGQPATEQKTPTHIPAIGELYEINTHLYMVRKKTYKGDLVMRRVG